MREGLTALLIASGQIKRLYRTERSHRWLRSLDVSQFGIFVCIWNRDEPSKVGYNANGFIPLQVKSLYCISRVSDACVCPACALLVCSPATSCSQGKLKGTGGGTTPSHPVAEVAGVLVLLCHGLSKGASSWWTSVSSCRACGKRICSYASMYSTG
jgi:hypothetical protein